MKRKKPLLQKDFNKNKGPFALGAAVEKVFQRNETILSGICEYLRNLRIKSVPGIRALRPKGSQPSR